MNALNAKPGDIIVSQFNMYQHYSIVSDQLCESGTNMLISATKRNGTVREERWEVVTQGKRSYIVNVKADLAPSIVIDNARAMINKWRYCLTSNNCEHFANWAIGLSKHSTQVAASTGVGFTVASLIAMASDKPNLAKVFGLGALLGCGALLLAKAKEKKRLSV